MGYISDGLPSNSEVIIDSGGLSIYELHGHVSFLKARISSAKSEMRA